MDELAGFEFYLSQNNRKRSTIRCHLQGLKRLLRDCKPLNKDSVTEFFLNLKRQGRRGSYLNKFVDVLRLYSQYKHDNIFTSLPFFKEETFVKATLSDSEIEAFLSLPCHKRRVISKFGKVFFRRIDTKLYDTWTLFFSIMAFTGMRPGEVAHLKIEDVDFGRDVFILEDTKTNEPRFVPIPPNLKDKIALYLKTLKQDYLFPSKKAGNHNGDGAVFDNVDWYYNFQTRIKRLGIKRKNLTCYSLRHSLITRLLEEDVNIFKVQKIVGHHQISTTQQYTHLTTKDICASIRKLPLIAKTLSPLEKLASLKQIIQNAMTQGDGLNYTITNTSIKVEVKS